MVDFSSYQNRILKSYGGWWLPHGVKSHQCVAAYQPKGALSLGESYTNLAHSGMFNAYPGVAPTWNAVDGWIFNGSGQYLRTGSYPALNQSWSFIVRFTNATTLSYAGLLGVQHTNVILQARRAYSTKRGHWHGDAPRLSTNDAVEFGIMGMAGRKVFFDGASDGADIPAGVGAYLDELEICRYAITSYFKANIQAIGIYNITLTTDQMIALTTAMNAL